MAKSAQSINLAAIVRTVAEQTGEKQTLVRQIAKSIFDNIGENMNTGTKVTIAGFGSFARKVTVTKAGSREVFGKVVNVKAGKKIRYTFRAAKALKA